MMNHKNKLKKEININFKPIQTYVFKMAIVIEICGARRKHQHAPLTNPIVSMESEDF